MKFVPIMLCLFVLAGCCDRSQDAYGRCIWPSLTPVPDAPIGNP